MKESISLLIVALLLHVIECAIGRSGSDIDMGHCVWIRNVSGRVGQIALRVIGSMYRKPQRVYVAIKKKLGASNGIGLE